MSQRSRAAAMAAALLACIATPATACSIIQGPPMSRAEQERHAREVHAGPGDLLELRMTAGATEAAPGRAIVRRSLKGKFRPGQVIAITTNDCYGHGDARAGLVFRSYVVRSPTPYLPLDRTKQALLVRLGLMPRAWGLTSR